MTSKLPAEWLHGSRAVPRAAVLLSLMMPLALGSLEPSSISQGDNGVVGRALANELSAAEDHSHPMQYLLRRSSPRLTSTKQIVETKDGAVARLVTVNDATLSAADRQKDEARLDALLADPSRQHRRKQSEQDDTGRALKVLRALPKAFLYQYAGSETSGSTTLERYTFSPNPKFSSADLELLVLTEMCGTLTIDSTHQRVVRLEGHLQQDVDIGWGILGRLNKGGWIVVEQADIGRGVWRIVRFQMVMNGRVFFKTRSFDTTEAESQFAPVPLELTYQQAIQMLRSSGADSAGPEKSGRNPVNIPQIIDCLLFSNATGSGL
jgi:hypothetical protein